jgi:succinate dehydrogenase / fumarate reductase cytochrome b subunit
LVKSCELSQNDGVVHGKDKKEMSETAQRSASGGARPKYRNIGIGEIVSYRLPPAGIVSILHRISGALMFLVGLPLVLYLFQQSLLSEISFGRFQALAGHWLVKLVLLGLLWAYLHHFCAGLRYLLLDVHVGTDKGAATRSAHWVMVISLVLTALVALKLFGVL